MTGAHDLPDLPDEWVCSTNKSAHVSFLHQPTSRSLAIMPDRKGGPDGWRVTGLAEYGGVEIATGRPFDLAVRKAVAEMERVASGEGATEGDAGEDHAERDDATDDTSEEPAGGQASLDAF